MKKFLVYIILFLVPVFILLASSEVLVQNIPNSYSYKYNYVLNKGDSIQAISLGHSQLYDGFMPEVFEMKAFNLCNSAQSFKEDFYILESLLPSMPNLKCVILPIGYMNVMDKDKDKGGFTERSTFYYEYMKVSYDNKIPFKYRYEFLDPKRAFEKITSYYLHHIDIVGCDSLGRRSTHNLKDRKHELGYEKVLYDYTAKTHDKRKLHIQVGNYLEKILSMLNSKNIKVVLVSPPHYWACFNEENKEQKEFLHDYIITLRKKYDFKYINLENDSRFVDNDFYNETHLSEIGAEKFTKILNDSIN